MSDEPVPDPTHDVLVEIRDELRALNRYLTRRPGDDQDGDAQPAVPVDGR